MHTLCHRSIGHEWIYVIKVWGLVVTEIVCCQSIFSHPSTLIRLAELGKVKLGNELQGFAWHASTPFVWEKKRHVFVAFAHFHSINIYSPGPISSYPCEFTEVVKVGEDTNNSSPAQPSRLEQHTVHTAHQKEEWLSKWEFIHTIKATGLLQMLMWNYAYLFINILFLK
jgi:hypothetical protein